MPIVYKVMFPYFLYQLAFCPKMFDAVAFSYPCRLMKNFILQKRKLYWDKQKKKGCLNMPTRKSERLAKRMKLMASLLLTQRKKIGVGEHFQAEVPDWTGQPSGKELSRYRSDPETSKWLGTRMWPPEGEVYKTDIVAVGQGRPGSCSCPFPGSFFCRQLHINEARDQLRSELGQVFTMWQFDSMGEEVSKLWSRDEQLKFDALEQLVPVMDQKTYWAVVSKNFASKPRIDSIKYYLNVFLMRRVLSQCRLSLLEIDSDEDEVEEEEDEDQPEGSSSLQRYLISFIFHDSIWLCNNAVSRYYQLHMFELPFYIWMLAD
jgi:hypothetical protein